MRTHSSQELQSPARRYDWYASRKAARRSSRDEATRIEISAHCVDVRHADPLVSAIGPLDLPTTLLGRRLDQLVAGNGHNARSLLGRRFSRSSINQVVEK
jgi:hypothetical protein